MKFYLLKISQGISFPPDNYLMFAIYGICSSIHVYIHYALLGIVFYSGKFGPVSTGQEDSHLSNQSAPLQIIYSWADHLDLHPSSL